MFGLFGYFLGSCSVSYERAQYCLLIGSIQRHTTHDDGAETRRHLKLKKFESTKLSPLCLLRYLLLGIVLGFLSLSDCWESAFKTTIGESWLVSPPINNGWHESLLVITIMPAMSHPYWWISRLKWVLGIDYECLVTQTWSAGYGWDLICTFKLFHFDSCNHERWRLISHGSHDSKASPKCG